MIGGWATGMIRPFLFMSGEFRVSMPIVFANEQWSHTMSSCQLELNEENGTFHRKGINEQLKGVIYHASVTNPDIRRSNFNFLIDNDIPCWPDPRVLRDIDDRHAVMNRCINAGLVHHTVVQGLQGLDIPFSYPFVVKTGNEHQGEGKFLVRNADELPKWEGIATIEPYFEGISCRVLMVGDDHWCVRYDNEESWIKNSAGAELQLWPEMPRSIVHHAKRVRDLFGLEICGIDYVANVVDGYGNFLGYNQFPGVDIDDAVTPIISQFFREKMKKVEQIAKIRYTGFT